MLRVRDIMTRDVVTVSPEDTLRDAMELLAKHQVSGAPVVRDGRLVGVVSAMDLVRVASTVPSVPTLREGPTEWGESMEPSTADEAEAQDVADAAYFLDRWDDAGAEVSERVSESEAPEWSPLDEHLVSEAMSLGVVRLPPDASVAAAAALMRDNGIHRILVTEGDRVAGVVSALDLVRAAAAGRLTRRIYVFNDDEKGDRGAE